MWLALLGFHIVGLVGFNLTLRQSILNKIDKFTLSTVLQTGIAVPCVILLIVHPTQLAMFSSTTFIYLATAIILAISLQVANVKALQYLEASVFSVFYNLRIILTTVIGILFLSEATDWLRIAGGVLILLAIFIVKQRSSHSLRVKGAMWGIAAALIISFLNLSEKKLILNVGFLNYFPIESVISAVIMWAYLIRSNRSFKFDVLRQPAMIRLMTLRAMSAFGFSGALAAGALVSVANYISGMSVIFMVLLGVLLLDERDYLRRKVFATLLAIAGLTIVLISSV
jgi:drug/metabolite transporter (DMT)-like permease